MSNRANDAVIIITQDNARKNITIRELNVAACEILMREAQSLTGKPLADILPPRITRQLEEYVEYEDEGNDAAHVLNRVMDFAVVSEGKEVQLRQKALRSDSPDGRAHFRLILQREADKKDSAQRAKLREHMTGHNVMDEGTGLPDRASMQKSLELVHYYCGKEAFAASFAVIMPDGDSSPALLKHYSALIKGNLRADDVVGMAADGALAVILFDAVGDSARMVLNRLRWLLAANPLQAGQVSSVSIACADVGAEQNGKEMLAQLVADLEGSAESNTLLPRG